MKKILMTLFAAATILAVGCKKDENAVADENSMARMAGVWRLAEIKFDTVVIHPENYASYVHQEDMELYQEFLQHYQNGVELTFHGNLKENGWGIVEVYGEEFEYQIRDNGQKIAFSGDIKLNIEGHEFDYSDREVPCTVLSLTEEAAEFEGQIPGFVIPLPRFFHFPGGTASCRLVRIGEAPVYPENPADTI